MQKKTNISHKVFWFLFKNPNILQNLQEGIINYSALAKKIKEEEKIKGTLHAIISALRRFQEHQKKETNKKISHILKKAKISTKSRLIALSLRRDFDYLKKKLPLLYQAIDIYKGEVLRTMETRRSFTIIIDQSKKEAIKKILGKTTLTEKNLGEIAITIDEEDWDKPKILSTIINALAAEDISISNLIATKPEIIFYVDEKNIPRAYSIILKYFSLE